MISSTTHYCAITFLAVICFFCINKYFTCAFTKTFRSPYHQYNNIQACSILSKKCWTFMQCLFDRISVFFFNFNSLIRQKNLDIFTQQNIENFRWRFVFYEMVALIFHWKSEQVVLHSLLPVLKYFTANIDDFPLINYLGIVVIVPWSELSGLAADWCILHSI